MVSLSAKKLREHDAEAVKAVKDFLATDEWTGLLGRSDVGFKWKDYQFQTVADEYQDSGRWTEHWEAVVQVFRTTGEWGPTGRGWIYVAFDYEVPSTESQGGLEDFRDEIGEPFVVEPHMTTVTVWKRKKE